MKKFLFIALLSLLGFPRLLLSGELPKNEMTLDPEQTEQFARLWVNYHERICPFQTLAIDFTTKLTGKPRYEHFNAEQFLLGWIFYPQKWKQVDLFKIEHPQLKQLINPSGKASFSDFFNPDGTYKLEQYWKEMYGSEKQTPFSKEAIRLDEKIQLIAMVQRESLLKLFPLQSEKGQTQWYSPADELPDSADRVTKLFIISFFPMYSECIQTGRNEEALSLINKLSVFQQKMTGSALPSNTHLKAELLNNKVAIFSWLFMACLTIGCIGIFIFIFCTVKNKKIKWISSVFYGLLICLFLVLTSGLALRGYIAGRLPVSNGYETMLFISWCSLLVGLLFRKSSFLMTNFSLILSGFTLLVAHITSMNPQITPLVPVLQSPLLSVHVSLIMIAYGLCGFMMLNSLTSFIILACSKNNPQASEQIENMKELSELFMFPATFFMGAGIFIGAIWANVSWGRYWGWDPKEVWALITFILMSFTFHGKTLTWFRKPIFYHLFVLIVFAAVLMTYFGVNYILGGKHSYAGN